MYTFCVHGSKRALLDNPQRGRIVNKRVSMSGLFGAIIAAAVALSFLTGSVSWVSPASIRDASYAGCASAIHDAGALGQGSVAPPFDVADVPEYDGEPSVDVNGGEPYFTDEDRAVDFGYQYYSELDRRGRCGAAFALVGPETLPTTTRGSIGMVRPSGWRIARYSWIDGEYLFNRCHLIGYLLTGQNANERNLITGTRFMNVNGMLPYEEHVSSYVHRTGNHVLYRVTPLFEGRNLVASGVLMEAESLEDGGEGICFCVWCYNVEPGVVIDYATGESHADGTIEDVPTPQASGQAGEDDQADPAARVVEIDPEATFVLNTSSMKFHRPNCQSVQDMGEAHREMFYGSREEAIDAGYVPCGWCKP